MRFYPLGDSALVIEYGNEVNVDNHRRVQALTQHLLAGFKQGTHAIHGLREVIPAFTTVSVLYDAGVTTYDEMLLAVKNEVDLASSHHSQSRIVRIPVCYGDEFGPDLEFVARHNGLSVSEVIELHQNADYLVYMIGFAPGFPYLGGMSEKIATPRRGDPRLAIPAGTVGIAGMQTGVYPLETPGGWQLIGRTPAKLFRPNHESPCLLQSGDIVRFYAISRGEFDQWNDDSEVECSESH